MNSAKKPSLVQTLLSNIFILFLIALLVITVVDMYRWVDRFYDEMEQRRDDYIEERKSKLMNDVVAAWSLIEFEQNTLEADLKKDLKSEIHRAIALVNQIYTTYYPQMGKEGVIALIKESLRNIRFLNGRGYFFVCDMQGNVIMNADKPELEGTSLWNMRNQEGTYVMRELIALAQSDSGRGYLRYYWTKPGVEGEYSKISYISRIEKLDFFIGTGEYLEDFSEVKKGAVKDMLKALRNSDGTYMFAGQYDGVSLIGPAEGKNMWEVKDSDGKKVVQELVSTAKSGGGYVEYHMPRETGMPPSRKISYVVPIPEWEWYVGTGAFFDDIEEGIAAQEARMKRMIAVNVGSHILIGALLILFVWFFVRRYSRHIREDVDGMNLFFNKASKHNQEEVHDAMHFLEMDAIARFAEKMVEERETAEENLRLSDKLRAVGQLAGGIAHDFNNILGAMLGAAEIASDPETPEEERMEFLQLIQSSTERAGELTRKLLTFSRKGQKVSTAIDMNSVVEDAVLLLQRTVDKKVTITIENRAEKTMVVGDDTLLQNALINMGINASHAMPDGGELTYTLENLILDEEYCEIAPYDITPGEYLAIAVRDTGFGMSPEVQERIFEPFFTTKAEGDGTGLGLAAVYGTVVEHDGAITVYSEKDKGTVFHIYLPLSNGAVIMKEREGELYTGTGTVLLIDDEELIRITAASILKTLGYIVLLAENGKEGLAVYKENRDEIDLIVLDMIMPVMGGRETFEEIRKFDDDIPIIISSGFAKEEDLAAMSEQGITGFLHKPFRREEIAEMVARSIHKK